MSLSALRNLTSLREGAKRPFIGSFSSFAIPTLSFYPFRRGISNTFCAFSDKIEEKRGDRAPFSLPPPAQTRRFVPSQTQRRTTSPISPTNKGQRREQGNFPSPNNNNISGGGGYGRYERFCSLKLDPGHILHFNFNRQGMIEIRDLEGQQPGAQAHTNFYVDSKQAQELVNKLAHMRRGKLADIERMPVSPSAAPMAGEKAVGGEGEGPRAERVLLVETLHQLDKVLYFSVVENADTGRRTLYISRHLYELDQRSHPAKKLDHPIKTIGFPLRAVDNFCTALTETIRECGRESESNNLRGQKLAIDSETEKDLPLKKEAGELPGRAFFRIGKADRDFSQANVAVYWHVKRRTESEVIWPVEYDPMAPEFPSLYRPPGMSGDNGENEESGENTQK